MTDTDGLYYMRARYYDTSIRRFINQDVLLGNIKNDQSLNRYAYVNGQPVSNTDPFGLCDGSDTSLADWRTGLSAAWEGSQVHSAFSIAAPGIIAQVDPGAQAITNIGISRILNQLIQNPNQGFLRHITVSNNALLL